MYLYRKNCLKVIECVKLATNHQSDRGLCLSKSLDLMGLFMTLIFKYLLKNWQSTPNCTRNIVGMGDFQISEGIW